MKNLVILHIAPLSFKKSSGMTTSIPSLIAAQNLQPNVNTALVISKGKKPDDWCPDFPVFLYHQDFIDLTLRDLPNPFAKPDLVVFHSTYIPIQARFAQALQGRKIPYIIVPRGGMTKESQNMKWFKKRLGNVLFFNKMVNGALAIHCLTKGEAHETEFWRKEIFITGNGMKVPFNNENNRVNTHTHKGMNFVFIGRLDPYHKGLDVLLDACSNVEKQLNDKNVKIKIYGPDEDGSFRILQRKINELGLHDIIELNGPVYDLKKVDVLKNADIFVHTSRFEGHPMSVLEALSYGVPCLLTPGTNISEEVAEGNAGWEVQFSAESISKGIEEIITNTVPFKEMSNNARLLIADNYSWNKIALETIDHYYRILELQKK